MDKEGYIKMAQMLVNKSPRKADGPLHTWNVYVPLNEIREILSNALACPEQIPPNEATEKAVERLEEICHEKNKEFMAPSIRLKIQETLALISLGRK